MPVYWLVDLGGRKVEVFSDPHGSVYRKSRSYRSGETIPVILDGVEAGTAAVDSILPSE